MYGQEIAEVYEIYYRSRDKDWAAEAAELTGLIRSRSPEASSLLDVACGTGAHLAAFRERFDQADGLEISAAMCRIAAMNSPKSMVHQGDMRAFDIGQTFDAVCCLFSSIAHARGVGELRGTIAAMASHLRPGGVLVLEPWWFPEKFIDGYVAGDLGREEGRTVVRVSHSVRDGREVQIDVRFLAADSSGIREFGERHVLSLFTENEYASAFESAGCPVEYVEGGPFACGLFVGVRSS